MRVKPLPLLALSLLLGGHHLSAEAPLPVPPLQRLGNEIAGSVSTGVLRGVAFLRYCPDNTCVVFEAPSTRPVAILEDFATAFLFYAGDSTNLRQYVSYAQSAARLVVAQHAASCHHADELRQASCVLSAFAATSGIRVFDERFDEGATFRTERSVSERASFPSLQRLQEWRAQQWNTRP